MSKEELLDLANELEIIHARPFTVKMAWEYYQKCITKLKRKK